MAVKTYKQILHYSNNIFVKYYQCCELHQTQQLKTLIAPLRQYQLSSDLTGSGNCIQLCLRVKSTKSK